MDIRLKCLKNTLRRTSTSLLRRRRILNIRLFKMNKSMKRKRVGLRMLLNHLFRRSTTSIVLLKMMIIFLRVARLKEETAKRATKAQKLPKK